MGEVSYNWIGTDGFEVKSETERFTVVCPRCRKTLNLVISRSSFDECGRELFKNACRTCSTIILVLLTNNITACLVVVFAESSSFLKLPIVSSNTPESSHGAFLDKDGLIVLLIYPTQRCWINILLDLNLPVRGVARVNAAFRERAELAKRLKMILR